MNQLKFRIIYVLLILGLFSAALLGLILHWGYYLICPLLLIVLKKFVLVSNQDQEKQ